MSVHAPVSARLSRRAFEETLEFFRVLGLTTAEEIAEILSLFDADFAFGAAMESASSVHCHYKVADVDALPHDAILARGTAAESCTAGYVKYPFPGGINMIFSSIDISEDDLLPGEPAGRLPRLDHKGIDLRTETDDVRSVFDAVPERAASRGWRHVAQGGGGTPVYCCHTEVDGKHWVYPPTGDPSHSRPVELAFGSLKIHDAKMGCDLRPIDPAHPRAAEARAALSACIASHSAEGDGAATNGTYYRPADLGHFADVGHFATPMMDRFWAYYNATFGADTALTKREKSLIALAVAHSKQCPYCIDAYTNTCLDAGATVEQMHEAVHCAAALGAGIDLVHATQMQNVLRARGAITEPGATTVPH